MTIPCTPTSRDVKVELVSATSGRRIDESDFGVEFSLYEGFRIEHPIWNMEWSDLICRARLDDDVSEVAIKIVWSPAPSYSLPPTITSSSLRHVIGNDVRLNCSLKVEKGVIVTISWKAPKKTVSKSVTKRVQVGPATDLVTNVLTIKESQFDDSGSYICTASYPNSQSQSAQVEITIVNSTRVLIQERSVSGKVGSEMEFFIPLNSSLNPETYSWSKDGKVVNETRFVVDVSESVVSIHVSNLETNDSGRYELSIQVDGFIAYYIFTIDVIDESSLFVNPFILLAFLTGLIVTIVSLFKSRKCKSVDFTHSNETSIFDLKSERIVPLRKMVPSSLVIKKSQITLVDQEIGSGAFGSVSKGILHIRGNQRVTVAVKQGRDDSSLAEEVMLMSRLDPHPNIVNLIGAVLHPNLMIVVEFCPLGNLKNFLMNNRNNFGKPASMGFESKLTANGICEENPHYESTDGYQCLQIGDLTQYAIQVANGMRFLASKKIIHRDLAARNVLLENRNLAKICDFGLSKNCYNYGEAIYLKKINSPLPIKWMAIESILDKIFTPKSDVWSYGIFLWELFTLGNDPYPGHEIDKVFLQNLLNGYRLDVPTSTPQLIARIMTKCWEQLPDERPDFDQIHSMLVSSL